MPTNENDLILARMRGVPAQQMTKIEALMDPTYPQRHEANDNKETGMPFFGSTGKTPRRSDERAYYAIQFGWCTEHEVAIRKCGCPKPDLPKPEAK